METFMLGQVTVLPELNRLRVAGQDIHIEPKVMALLEALAEHPQQVVARQQLLDRVWSGTVVGEEALTRCVSQLRSALGDRATNPTYIQTVPKRGYRLLLIPRPPVAVARSVPADRHGRAVRWLASALTVLAALMFAAWTAQSPDRPRSIAVPTFDAATLAAGSTLSEYFGDGFVEDLQSALVGPVQAAALRRV